MSEPWYGRNKVAVVGVGYSETGRRLQRPLGLLARDAARAACEDAGLDTADIAGVSTNPDMPIIGATAGAIDGVHVVSAEYMIHALGIGGTVQWYNQNSNGLIATSVIEAVNAIAAGRCNNALVWRAMKMPQGRYNAWDSACAPGPLQFTVPYGNLQGAVPFGLSYRDYLHRYGAGREHLGRYLVSNRANAHRNPRAYFRDKPLTLEDYLGQRMIAEPLGIFDCDIPLDGCAAIVLASADRARDLRNPPAYVAGYGQSTRPSADFWNLADLDYLAQSGASMASKVWDSSGLSPSDVQTAMLYDGFSPFVLWWLEAFGFCKRGEAWQYVADGATDIGRELPVNTSGGSLGEGRIHGMAHLAEAVYQVTGRAGERQVPDVHHALAVVGPLAMMSGGLIFSRSPN